jgi:glucans biosynthesis protein
VGTRHGRTKTHESDLERFFIDFSGKELLSLETDPEVESVVTVGAGAKLVHSIVQKNPYNNTWRAAFAIQPDGTGRPVELRCFLKKPQQVLSETWSYLWQP